MKNTAVQNMKSKLSKLYTASTNKIVNIGNGFNTSTYPCDIQEDTEQTEIEFR